MKLVIIKHIRCGEPSGATLLWAPDFKSLEAVEQDANEAQRALLKSYAELPAEGTRHYFPQPLPDLAFLNSRSDLTVEFALTEWAAREEHRKQDAERAAQARRSFSDYMKNLGYVSFYDHEPDTTFELEWGHRHGVSIDYGSRLEEEPRSNVLAGTDVDPGFADR